MTIDDTANIRLCEALAKARAFRSMDLTEAAEALGMSPKRLAAIEHGEEHPERELVQAFADLYRLDAERLGGEVMVKRSEPAIDPDECILWFNWLPIEYGSNLRGNREILEAVADGLRLLRSTSSVAPIRMRTPELDILLTLLDLSSPDLVADSVRAFRVPWKEMEEMIEDSKARVRTKSLVNRARCLVSLQTAD